MSFLVACRACLSPNVYLCPAPPALVDQFQNLTKLMMQEGDGKPLGLCRLCCHYLTKYQKFRNRCFEADGILNQLKPSSTEESLEMDFNMSVSGLAPALTCSPVQIEELLTWSNTDPLVIEVKQEIKDASHINEDIKYCVGEGIHRENIAQVQNNPLNSLTPELVCAPVHIKELPPPVPRRHTDPLSIDLKQVMEDARDNFEHIKYDVAERKRREKFAQVCNKPLNSAPEIICALAHIEELPPPVPSRRTDPLAIELKQEIEDTSGIDEDIMCNVAERICRESIVEVQNNPSLDYKYKVKLFQHNVPSSSIDPLQVQKIQYEEESERKFGNDNDNLSEDGDLRQDHTTGDTSELACDNLLIGEKPKPYQCMFCEKIFANKGNLNIHLNIHSGVKPYQCQGCEKRFVHKTSLNNHLKLHTGERPYQCEVCFKRFRHKTNLKSHLNVHTGEKPYRCKVCMKSFGKKNTLNNHLTVHTGEKPYQCEVCEKRFGLKITLNNHLKVHTGEKPYMCKVCEKSFSTTGSLNRHRIIHTRVKPYQ